MDFPTSLYLTHLREYRPEHDCEFMLRPLPTQAAYEVTLIRRKK